MKVAGQKKNESVSDASGSDAGSGDVVDGGLFPMEKMELDCEAFYRRVVGFPSLWEH